MRAQHTCHRSTWPVFQVIHRDSRTCFKVSTQALGVSRASVRVLSHCFAGKTCRDENEVRRSGDKTSHKAALRFLPRPQPPPPTSLQHSYCHRNERLRLMRCSRVCRIRSSVPTYSFAVVACSFITTSTTKTSTRSGSTSSTTSTMTGRRR